MTGDNDPLWLSFVGTCLPHQTRGQRKTYKSLRLHIPKNITRGLDLEKGDLILVNLKKVGKKQEGY